MFEQKNVDLDVSGNQYSTEYLFPGTFSLIFNIYQCYILTLWFNRHLQPNSIFIISVASYKPLEGLHQVSVTSKLWGLFLSNLFCEVVNIDPTTYVTGFAKTRNNHERTKIQIRNGLK